MRWHSGARAFVVPCENCQGRKRRIVISNEMHPAFIGPVAQVQNLDPLARRNPRARPARCRQDDSRNPRRSHGKRPLHSLTTPPLSLRWPSSWPGTAGADAPGRNRLVVGTRLQTIGAGDDGVTSPPGYATRWPRRPPTKGIASRADRCSPRPTLHAATGSSRGDRNSSAGVSVWSPKRGESVVIARRVLTTGTNLNSTNKF